MPVPGDRRRESAMIRASFWGSAVSRSRFSRDSPAAECVDPHLCRTPQEVSDRWPHALGLRGLVAVRLASGTPDRLYGALLGEGHGRLTSVVYVEHLGCRRFVTFGREVR